MATNANIKIERAQKSLRDSERLAGGRDSLDTADKLEALAMSFRLCNQNLTEADKLELQAKAMRGRIAAGQSKQANCAEKGERAFQATAERECPFCAEVIRAKAKICRFCQRNLTDSLVKEVHQSLDQSEVIIANFAGVVALAIVAYSYFVPYFAAVILLPVGFLCSIRGIKSGAGIIAMMLSIALGFLLMYQQSQLQLKLDNARQQLRQLN